MGVGIVRIDTWERTKGVRVLVNNMQIMQADVK